MDVTDYIKIRKCYPSLVRKMDVKAELLSFLYQDGIIGDTNQEIILNKPCIPSRAQKLLELMQKTAYEDQSPFPSLLRALRECGQEFLAKELKNCPIYADDIKKYKDDLKAFLKNGETVESLFEQFGGDRTTLTRSTSAQACQTGNSLLGHKELLRNRSDQRFQSSNSTSTRSSDPCRASVRSKQLLRRCASDQTSMSFSSTASTDSYIEPSPIYMNLLDESIILKHSQSRLSSDSGLSNSTTEEAKSQNTSIYESIQGDTLVSESDYSSLTGTVASGGSDQLSDGYSSIIEDGADSSPEDLKLSRRLSMKYSKIQEVSLEHKTSWKAGLVASESTFYVPDPNNEKILMYGTTLNNEMEVASFNLNGTKIHSWKPTAESNGFNTVVFRDKNKKDVLVIGACEAEKQLHLYDIETGVTIRECAYYELDPGPMCNGPEGQIMVVDRSTSPCKIALLDCALAPLPIFRKINSSVRDISGICFGEAMRKKVIFVCSSEDKCLAAIDYETGRTIWRESTETWQPNSICMSDEGCLFVTNLRRRSEELFVYDLGGDLITTLSPPAVQGILDVQFMSFKNQLFLLIGHSKTRERTTSVFKLTVKGQELAGLGLIIAGAVVQSELSTYFDFFGGSVSAAAILLIVVGVIIFIIGFFGCCGAYKENYCMVMTFAFLLGLVFILEISAGIAAYVMRDQVEDMIQEKMRDSMTNFNKDGYEGVTKAWTTVQRDFKCCGVDEPSDWKNVTEFAPDNVPDSCCITETTGCGTDKTAPKYDKGCINGFVEWVKGNIYVVGGLGIGLAFIQIFGIILACCLARTIKKEYEVV